MRTRIQIAHSYNLFFRVNLPLQLRIEVDQWKRQITMEDINEALFFMDVLFCKDNQLYAAHSVISSQIQQNVSIMYTRLGTGQVRTVNAKLCGLNSVHILRRVLIRDRLTSLGFRFLIYCRLMISFSSKMFILFGNNILHKHVKLCKNMTYFIIIGINLLNYKRMIRLK